MTNEKKKHSCITHSYYSINTTILLKLMSTNCTRQTFRFEYCPEGVLRAIRPYVPFTPRSRYSNCLNNTHL